MENKYKAKLKRRGKEVYRKYFFNPNHIISEIIKQIDNKNEVNENLCQVVFNVSDSYTNKIYELIKYYPNKLKEIKFIDEKIVDELYEKYGVTIDIMNKNYNGIKNVRGKICESANKRAKEKNILFNITNEDIILVATCPLLNIPLEYGNNLTTKYSASIDRIDNTKGYTKDNIQILSMLANSMKSSATFTELITFSKNILKLYQ
jgi:uncharacterized protein YlxP (DUF503 family)